MRLASATERERGPSASSRRGWVQPTPTRPLSPPTRVIPRVEVGSSGDGSKAVTENTTKEDQVNIGVCDICGAETEVVEIIYGSSSVKYCRECLLDADLNDAT